MGRLFSIHDTLHVLPSWISFTLWQQRTGFWNHTRLLLGLNDISSSRAATSECESQDTDSLRPIAAESDTESLQHTITFSNDTRRPSNNARNTDCTTVSSTVPGDSLHHISAYGRTQFWTAVMQQGDIAKCTLLVRNSSVMVSVSVETEGNGSNQLISDEVLAQTHPHQVVQFVAPEPCRLSLKVSALTVKGADVCWDVNIISRKERTCVDRAQHRFGKWRAQTLALFDKCCRVIYRLAYYVLVSNPDIFIVKFNYQTVLMRFLETFRLPS
jgi:hypothetical protein